MGLSKQDKQRKQAEKLEHETMERLRGVLSEHMTGQPQELLTADLAYLVAGYARLKYRNAKLLDLLQSRGVLHSE